MNLTYEDIQKMLPDRAADSHKGDFGKILLICGSRGYTGAAALAAKGALRCGAGLVYLAVPESIYMIEAVKLDEPVVLPIPEDTVGAVNAIIKLLPQMDTVLVGPGMGRSERTFKIVQTVLDCFAGPVVVDADGINVLEGHIDILRGRTGVTILTPHDGEFRRLGGTRTGDREADAKALAVDTQSIVLLKGHYTVITDGTHQYTNPTGNPGMAVGGCGDVLAGIITALIGQGIVPLEAAACGAWIHGAAGDICAEEIGQYGMLPTDMLKVLPRLLK